MDLQIVTPDGKAFGGPAQKLFCRTVGGDVCILPRHCNYCTPIGMGEARVTAEDGTVRRAACIGGILAIIDGRVTLTPNTFEWAEQIDVARAKEALERAKESLAKDDLSERERKRIEAKEARAIVRIQVAEPNKD
jgi:F-type H+-transporting ATPase subunit epsilon